jgi:hypothetical protein
VKIQKLVDFFLFFSGENQEKRNQSSLYSYFSQRGKLIKVTSEDLKFLELYTNKQANYILLFDQPDQTSKSPLAKQISESLGFKLVK